MSRCLRSHRGQSLVEFGFVLPLLLILTFGIIEYGLLIYNQQVITNASREGARAGIVSGTPRVPYYTGAGSIKSVVEAYCLAHLVTFGAQNVPQTVVAPATYDSNAPFGTNLSVTVTYQFSFLLMPSFVTGTSGNLQAVTLMKYE